MAVQDVNTSVIFSFILCYGVGFIKSMFFFRHTICLVSEVSGIYQSVWLALALQLPYRRAQGGVPSIFPEELTRQAEFVDDFLNRA